MCRELVGVGCPFVVIVNTVMSVILAIAITAIAAITAIIKPIKQLSFSPDSFSIGLPVAYHSSRCLVKGARRKPAKGRGLRPEPPPGRGVLKARARHFGWPAGRQAGKTRERHDADGQRQGGKTICRSSACAHLFPIVFYSILLTCNDE